MSKKVCHRITRINANEGRLFSKCRIRLWFLRLSVVSVKAIGRPLWWVWLDGAVGEF
jgi:hypothetical protein